MFKGILRVQVCLFRGLTPKMASAFLLGFLLKTQTGGTRIPSKTETPICPLAGGPVRTLTFLPTNGCSVLKPLKVQLLAGEQISQPRNGLSPPTLEWHNSPKCDWQPTGPSQFQLKHGLLTEMMVGEFSFFSLMGSSFGSRQIQLWAQIPEMRFAKAM